MCLAVLQAEAPQLTPDRIEAGTLALEVRQSLQSISKSSKASRHWPRIGSASHCLGNTLTPTWCWAAGSQTCSCGHGFPFHSQMFQTHGDNCWHELRPKSCSAGSRGNSQAFGLDGLHQRPKDIESKEKRLEPLREAIIRLVRQALHGLSAQQRQQQSPTSRSSFNCPCHSGVLLVVSAHQ